MTENKKFVLSSNGTRIIQSWIGSTKFVLYASHKNNIGTIVDEKTHCHLWSVGITAQYHMLNRNSTIFNFKTIASFVFDTLNGKDLNDILENKEKYIDRRHLKYIEDVVKEPSNEVISQLIGRLVYSKIIIEDPEMKGIEILVDFDKDDNIKENEICKNKKIELSAQTHVQYSCKEIT